MFLLAHSPIGQYHVCCGDLGISILARAGNGLAPRNTLCLDVLLLPVIALIGAVYRRVWERTVRQTNAK